MKSRIPLLMCFILFVTSAVVAREQQDTCILNATKDGQTITVHGKAVRQPHDLAFEITDCSDLAVLVYAGNPDTDVAADKLRRDENFKRFEKYTSQVYKGTKKAPCIQCAQYDDVEATLTGKLEIATIPPGTTKDRVGFLHDATGKVVGTSGFGHPSRMFKYRLVILSVSDVKARKAPKPSLPKSKEGS